MRIRILLLLLALATVALPAATAVTLVVCSPGSPGNTAQAQPTMDAFAADAAAAAGWPASRLGAVYFEAEKAGLDRLAQDDAALAMVPLSFYVEHGAALKLDPILSVVPEGGDAGGKGEVWSLVAHKGDVTGPGSLAGWQITGAPGYAEAYVRHVLLAGFGPLPDGVTITFAPRVLSALRKAAAGEKVAALLDPAEVKALGSLPFGSDLEVVFRSRPLPAALLCVVGGRVDPKAAAALADGLRKMNGTEAGRTALTSIRVERFAPVDDAALEAVLSEVRAGQGPAR